MFILALSDWSLEVSGGEDLRNDQRQHHYDDTGYGRGGRGGGRGRGENRRRQNGDEKTVLDNNEASSHETGELDGNVRAVGCTLLYIIYYSAVNLRF